MSVAILGSGSLSTQLQQLLPDHKVFTKPQLDFLDDQSIVDVVPSLVDFTTIINCIGIYSGTSRDILSVNFLSPLLLTEQLVKHNYSGHVIMIGSHSATWPSWPGITHERLIYANSKLSLRNYMFGLAQSDISPMRITVVDLTKFQSKMSDHQGYDIKSTATIVANVVNQDIKILHVEAY